MKRNNDYFLSKLHNDYYFVPTKQAAADFRPVVTTNATGAFLWNALKQNRSLDELLTLAKEEYSAENISSEVLFSDIRAYVDSLSHMGLIKETGDVVDNGGNGENPICGFTIPSSYFTIRIAELNIRIYGDDAVIPDFVSEFKCPDVPENLRINLIPEAFTFDDGKTIIRKSDAIIKETDAFYILNYSGLELTKQILIKKDSKETFIFYKKPDGLSDTVLLRKEIGLVMRVPFLLKVSETGAMMLHSSSVLYKGGLVLFSASSGTGKSTHAGIWNKIFATPVINGDTNLIVIKDENAVVYGTPWCGTSNIYTSESFPLKSIVFLKQGPEDIISSLNEAESAIKIFSRLINPLWSLTDAETISWNVEILSSKIKCASLECTMNDSAAFVCKEFIDNLSAN